MRFCKSVATFILVYMFLEMPMTVFNYIVLHFGAPLYVVLFCFYEMSMSLLQTKLLQVSWGDKVDEVFFVRSATFGHFHDISAVQHLKMTSNFDII